MDSWGKHLQGSWTWKLVELNISEVPWATKDDQADQHEKTQRNYQIIAELEHFLKSSFKKKQLVLKSIDRVLK